MQGSVRVAPHGLSAVFESPPDTRIGFVLCHLKCDASVSEPDKPKPNLAKQVLEVSSDESAVRDVPIRDPANRCVHSRVRGVESAVDCPKTS